jgi:hypothetical protein
MRGFFALIFIHECGLKQANGPSTSPGMEAIKEMLKFWRTV